MTNPNPTVHAADKATVDFVALMVRSGASLTFNNIAEVVQALYRREETQYAVRDALLGLAVGEHAESFRKLVLTATAFTQGDLRAKIAAVAAAALYAAGEPETALLLAMPSLQATFGSRLAGRVHSAHQNGESAEAFGAYLVGLAEASPYTA